MSHYRTGRIVRALTKDARMGTLPRVLGHEVKIPTLPQRTRQGWGIQGQKTWVLVTLPFSKWITQRWPLFR